MKLVLQQSNLEACGHACVAMLTDKTLAEIFDFSGSDRRLGTSHMLTILRQHSLQVPEWGYIVETLPAVNSLVGLMQRHKTLLCQAYSCLDPYYAHAVVIHEKQMYDPHLGMNPAWAWDRIISAAYPVDGVK